MNPSMNPNAEARTKTPTDVLTHAPVWSALSAREQQGFREVWRTRIVHPDGNQALWLRFALLSSNNGFRKVAEVWAVLFSKNESGETTKVALRQNFDIRSFQPINGSRKGLQISECELTDSGTRGMIQSKGRTIRWDFSSIRAQESSFNWIPEGLTRMGARRNRAFTLAEDLRFTGSTELDGEKLEWKAAPGGQSHLAGPGYWHSWTWAHCNTFRNEQGEPAYFVFEGFSARDRFFGLIPSPRMSSFFFLYQGREYRMNSLWNAIRSRSEQTLSEWKFQADCGDLSFRGEIQAENRDFAGFTYEDTNGSILYCSNAELARVTVWIYRRGKLEASFHSHGTAGFEVVSRQKNPYVPLLL